MLLFCLAKLLEEATAEHHKHLTNPVHAWQQLAGRSRMSCLSFCPANTFLSFCACSNLLLQAFAWMLATLPLLCHLRGWGLFLLFTTASIATAVSV
jgi:hypothetical protein